MDRTHRNALLAAEMTHRQPNRLIDIVTPIKNHLRRVFSGEVAREGVNRLNDTLRGVEQGNRNALNDLVGEIGFGGITSPMSRLDFQNWFGKSKVVDEGGQPLVVYHLGRTQPGGKAVETFYPGGQKGAEKSPLTGTQWEHKAVGAPALQSGPGIWFGPKDTLSVGTRDFNRPGGTHPGGTPQDMAVSEFAATYPSYLSLKNPLVITSHKQRAALKESIKPYPERKKGVEFRPDFPYRFDGKQRQQLINEGYDGIILDIPGEGKEYIAFYPEQIKSAIGE